MINSESHTKEWLTGRKQVFPKRDPQLIEKVIKAFTLLEQLKLAGLSFTFKGGTALLLLVDGIRRFSIDIDIVLPDRPANIDGLFGEIIRRGVFTRYEEQVRTSGKTIPKAHFKFYFSSHVEGAPKDPYILLDLLYESELHTQTAELPVQSRFISHGEPIVSVTVPTIASMLGDKMTAFAPNTTGILYGREKELEIIKQLYDVATLFDHCEDLPTVALSFERIATKELGYRELKAIGPRHVLDDIWETALVIAARGVREKDKFEELQAGVKKFQSYLFEGSFVIEDAILCAAKAGYLSRLISAGKSAIPSRFNKEIDLKKESITHAEYGFLNSIKKTRPEAFFCFQRAVELVVASRGESVT